jgi:uncharacterized repeat protein (TIGR03803 family)
MRLSRIVTATALTAAFLIAICPSVCAQMQYKETDLHNLGGGATDSGLTMDQFGNLYGVADTFFELTPNGSAGWNYTDLGSGLVYAYGPMVMDKAGNFYTSNYWASVVEYSPDGSGGFTSSTIYVLDGLASNLIIDGAGNLYAIDAGAGLYGFGYVAELSPIAGGGWSLTDLYDFRGKNGAVGVGVDDGIMGGLIMDTSGNLYGTTTEGGFSTNCSGGCGVVFELTNHSGHWTEAVLHSFIGTDGSLPDAPLLMDAAGNLYGTTALGGTDGWGEVFQMPLVSGKWGFSILYNFTGAGSDGAIPEAALIMDPAGNLYGTTNSGGGYDDCVVPPASGCGTAFKLSRKGGKWEETILHDFTGGDGAFPAGLISDAKGNLYGTTLSGGRGLGGGVVFELSPSKAGASK